MLRFRAFTLILWLFISFSVNSEVIKKIDIFGISVVDRGTVLSYLPIEVDDIFDQNVSKKIISSLYKTSLFENISLEFLDNGTLTINLKENPTIKYIDFKGYKEDEVLSKKIIESAVNNSNLQSGKVFIKRNFEKLLSEIDELYKSNGYFSSSINFKSDIDQSNRVGIEVNISEQEPTLIGRFTISGSSFYPSDELIDIFDIGEPDFFLLNYFTEKDKFNKNDLAAGIEKIRTKYLNSGFLDFKIIDTKTSLDNKTNKLSISISLNEGPRYFINTFSWKGDIAGFSEEYLDSVFAVKKDSPFSRSAIIAGANRIRSLFADNGYALATVSTTLKDSIKENYYNLDITVSKNNKMYVNRIEISGNTTTQDDVIRRQFSLFEGQEFSQKFLDDSIAKIKRTGFFEDVSVKTSLVDGTIDQFNIFVSVKETKTGEFTVGLSHSNASGAAFNTGIQQNNIFGTGNVFNAKFINSKAVEELRFYFKDPYFTNDGDSLSYGLFNKSTNAIDLDISDYVLDEVGGSVGYGVNLTKDSNLFGEIKLANYDLVCSSTYSGVLFERSQCLANNSFDFSTSLSYGKNTLNDFYNPTKGVKENLKIAVSWPIGDFKYYQLEGVKIDYYPTLENSTFSTKLNLDIAQGYGSTDLPFFKRYFSGGSSSVRGFDFNSLGAKYPDNSPKGGEVSLLSSIALISPGANLGIENENIRVSAFIDAGSIYETTSSLDLSEIRASTGLALSWLTPIGPIGFNFAEPLIKKSGDKTESFSFELGSTF